MLLLRLIALGCAIQFALSASAQEVAKVPSRYSIAQQVGATCFVSCWYNFKFIQDVRAKNGGQFLATVASSKTRYEWFMETSGVFDDWYKTFRIQSSIKGSAFTGFIDRVKKESVTTKDIKESYYEELNPIDKRSIASLFPHLLTNEKDSLTANFVYLPKPVSSVSTISVQLIGHTLYTVPNAMLDEGRVFYDFGLYKLMLMAAKVNSRNQIVADSATDSESLEILQLHKAMKASSNPWKDISLDHFLEYRFTNLLMTNAPLKKQVEAVVDVFYKTFGFYSDARKLELSNQ